jgi:hypothetical protein
MRPALLLLLLGAACSRASEGHPKGWSYDDVWGHGMWVQGLTGRERLKAVVYYPLTAGRRIVRSSIWRGETPLAQGLSLLPEGVFLDGKAVAMDEISPVLVWTRRSALVPLKLSAEAVASIEAEADTGAFHATPFWKETLRPLILKTFEE